MADYPLAYHITFGTYGTRLHGDERGTVDRKQNQFGEPIVGASTGRRCQEMDRLAFSPIIFDLEKMKFVESVLPTICRRGDWCYHIGAAGEDHVHILVAAGAEGNMVRKWLKRWMGEALSTRWTLPAGATWWAEGGSVKWVWEESYFCNVHDYIRRQRATR